MVPTFALLVPDLEGCTQLGLWCNPTYPGTPFATVLLAVADTIRVIVCITGAGTIALTLPSAIRRAATDGQRHRMLGLGLFCLYAVNTESNRLGDYPSIRLGIAVCAVAWAATGMWSFRYREQPAPPLEGDSRGDAV